MSNVSCWWGLTHATRMLMRMMTHATRMLMRADSCHTHVDEGCLWGWMWKDEQSSDRYQYGRIKVSSLCWHMPPAETNHDPVVRKESQKKKKIPRSSQTDWTACGIWKVLHRPGKSKKFTHKWQVNKRLTILACSSYYWDKLKYLNKERIMYTAVKRKMQKKIQNSSPLFEACCPVQKFKTHCPLSRLVAPFT